MGKLGVRNFSVSLDGFGAGPNQDLQNPLGVGGLALHDWFFATRTPYHTPVGGIREALALARDAAKDQDVRLGGGVATIRQFLQAGLVEEIHLAIAPVLLGAGESLLAGSTCSGWAIESLSTLPRRRPRTSCSQGTLRASTRRRDRRGGSLAPGRRPRAASRGEGRACTSP